jgi:phosphatidylglycerophosphate synthase
MRHNIADALTFFRFSAAIIVFVLLLNEHWFGAIVLFTLAIASDAMDGIAARRWKPKVRWYRKNPHDFDNAGDSLLFFGALLGLTIKTPHPWLYVMVVSIVGTAMILWSISYFRPSVAEKIDVAFGWCFGILLLLMLIQITALAMPIPWFWWAMLTYAITAGIIMIAKWDRMTSRPEVEYTGKR